MAKKRGKEAGEGGGKVARTEAEETARREMQRRKQAEARARQAAGGKTKAEAKKDKQALKKKSAGKKWREAEFKNKGRNDFRKERAASRSEWAEEAEGRRKHDVVVVPIFWRTRAGEEEAVVAEGERVKKLLGKVAPRLDVWIDRTHKKSPGQKFAFWEQVGVTCRLELGPDDVKNKQCLVAKISDGLARRVTVSSVDPKALLDAVRDTVSKNVPEFDLARWRDLIAAETSEADATLAAWARAAGDSGASAAAAANDDDLGGRGENDRRKAQLPSIGKIDPSAKRSTPLVSNPATRNDNEIDHDQWAHGGGGDDDDDSSDDNDYSSDDDDSDDGLGS